LVERFRRDLHATADLAGTRLGVAVSGGPDSLALLLLAAAALPDRVEAATVDHGLRAESAGEAAMVAEVSSRLCVPHRVLAPGWSERPTSNLAARARAARYDALCDWAGERRLTFIATAHHLDDQAETLLMRIARGAGLSGLAGVRPLTDYVGTTASAILVRPLLGWRKMELRNIVDACGLAAVEDPTNEDDRLDRTAVRRLLAEATQLDPSRLAACAAHLADADAALSWTADRLFEERNAAHADGSVTLNACGLPHELQRRLLLRTLFLFTDDRGIRGQKIENLLQSLRAGRPATLAGVRAEPGPPWRFKLAPPRRRR
jgi:tRNA(Ile)-lysidine synthase